MINVIYYPVPALLGANQTFTGNNTFTGSNIFSGPVTFSDIVVGTPTGGFSGPGTINVSGGFYVNGVPVGTSGVTSVFGRIGAVTAQVGDYSVGQVAGAAPLASPTFTGTVVAAAFVSTGTLQVDGDSGFYGTSPIAKPTVTGSKSGNAALASLMTALADLGLVTDSTT